MTITLGLWRHCDPPQAIPHVPDIFWQGTSTLEASDDPEQFAAALYGDGIRRVQLEGLVDLSGAAAEADVIPRLALLAALTSWGMAVEWDVRFGADSGVWVSFSHFVPPARLEFAGLDSSAAEQPLASWREQFYLGKCLYRHGPGFVQVRDRRDATLHRFTIDEPDFLAAVERLSTGCPARDVDPDILDAFVAEALVALIGQNAWWMPYRVRRWPWPSFAV